MLTLWQQDCIKVVKDNLVLNKLDIPFIFLKVVPNLLTTLDIKSGRNLSATGQTRGYSADNYYF